MTYEALKCPGCATDLQTLGGPFTLRTASANEPRELTSFDAGYCRQCSRMYFRDRASGEYSSATWAPICHFCRLELQLDLTGSGNDYHLYRCRKHPNEQRARVPSQNRWFNVSTEEKS